MFPGDADLALVQGQVETLNELLNPALWSGQVLIQQQRLAEFSQKMREASRLAAHLASAVEQSRKQDELQFHLYLMRRAQEIEQP